MAAINEIQKSIEMLLKQEERIYLTPGEKPPEGVQLFRGPKGGYYYVGHARKGVKETTEREKLPHFIVEAGSKRMEGTVDNFKKNIIPVFQQLPNWHSAGVRINLVDAEDIVTESAPGSKWYGVGRYEPDTGEMFISELAGKMVQKDLDDEYQNTMPIDVKHAWKLVVLHELGHRVMYEPKVINKYVQYCNTVLKDQLKAPVKNGFDMHISYEPNGKEVTQYATNDLAERFAEAYLYYVQGSEWLKKQDPDMYGFMKDSIFQGKEYSEGVVKQVGTEGKLPRGSWWMESEKYAKILLNRKDGITKSIDSFLSKAYRAGGSYVPVRTLVHRKDGSVVTAIRWKSFEQAGLVKISSRESLSAVRSLRQTTDFTKGSAVKQTMFLLVNEIDIDEILQSNFIGAIHYEFLGDGLYMYSNLEIAKERAKELGKEVLPVKVDVVKLYTTTMDRVRSENVPTLSEQGYEAIVLVREGVYEFDLFCFDNRDVVAIGGDDASQETGGDLQKSVEDYELENEGNLVTKEYLTGMKAIPAIPPADDKLTKAGKAKPAPLDKNGAVDYDAVQPGESIWITVTQEDSPLKGRPIIITKKPNGLFALTGGSGFSSIKNKKKGEYQSSDPYRHMEMAGRAKKTEAELENERKLAEAAEKNRPFIEKKKELEEQRAEELEEFRNELYGVFEVGDLDKNALRKHREELINLGKEYGIDDDVAKSFATSFIDAYIKSNRKTIKVAVPVKSLKIRAIRDKIIKGEISEEQGLEAINDVLKPADDFVSARSLKKCKGMTAEEAAKMAKDDVEEQFNAKLNRNPEEDSDDENLRKQGVEIPDSGEYRLDATPNMPPLKHKGMAEVEEVIKKFNDYYQTRKETEVIKKKIKHLNPAVATPAMVEQLVVSAKSAFGKEMTDEQVQKELDRLDDHRSYNDSAIAFYDATAEFWNNEESLKKKISPADSSFGGYIDSGATSALAALTGKYRGERVDVKKLVEKTNIGTATMLIAMDARTKMSPEKYDEFVEQVRGINAKTLRETEQRALDRNAVLLKRYGNYQRDKESGLLQPREAMEGFKEQTGMVEGEVDNIIERKKNLGYALGSMQASADLLHSLEVAKTAKNRAITLNFGDDVDGAKLRANELGLLEGARGNLDTSDPKNIRIKTSSDALTRYMRTLDVTKDIHDRNEKIKNDMSGTEYDEEENLVVTDYQMPGANNAYKDEEGNTRQLRTRVEQRNDIRFLQANSGNGLITRVTGAGKTNTCYGFLASQIKKDKNYSALVVVPKGRAGQWTDEAKKFFGKLDIVNLEGVGDKDVRSQMIANLKPGQVAIMGQPDAMTNYADLELSFNDGKFKGLVLDEPQEVASKSISGNMSATLRKLMKLNSENRIALTATPARDNLIEAYDLANWVSHHDKQLGPRSRFQAIYGGYGSGTNAQDATLQQMIYREISPYISGDRLTSPTFAVSKKDVPVNKSKKQEAMMRKIELNADRHIKGFREQYIREIESDPNKLKRWQNKSSQWKSLAGREATRKAREQVKAQHEENLSGISSNMTWKDNPKIASAIQRIAEDPKKKHVIFVDSESQRKAIKNGLADMAGYNDKVHIKNMSKVDAGKMARAAREFRNDKNVKVVFIDKKSSSGYNLQSGDDLHVIGTPSDAATYLQAQGRLARMPRKGDVGIYTYKYDDVPFEDQKWTKLENQLAILRATSPGLFVDEKKK